MHGTDKIGPALPSPSHQGEYLRFTHNPAQAAARGEARRRGGERRRAPHAGDPSAIPIRVRSANNVLAILDCAVSERLVLENSVGRSRVLIALGMMYLTVYPRAKSEESAEQYDRELALYGLDGVLERMAPPLKGTLTNVVKTDEEGSAGVAGKQALVEQKTGTMDRHRRS
jgi:hypothetical protein